MKIPDSFQIFSEPVVIDGKDQQRLAPYLTAWPDLHKRLTAGVNVPDLRRLVVLELLGAKRHWILRRLRMRLVTAFREELETKIDKLT